VAPQVPAVPSTYKDEAIARPRASQDAETIAAKEKARRSSNAIGFNHNNNNNNNNNTASQPLSGKSDRYSEDVADWNIMNSEKPNPNHAPAPLNVNKSLPDRSRQSSSSSYSTAPTPGIGQAAVSRKAVGSETARDVET
jgi:hypothetical protein